jgi:hypothetical protein
MIIYIYIYIFLYGTLERKKTNGKKPSSDGVDDFAEVVPAEDRP